MTKERPWKFAYLIFLLLLFLLCCFEIFFFLGDPKPLRGRDFLLPPPCGADRVGGLLSSVDLFGWLGCCSESRVLSVLSAQGDLTLLPSPVWQSHPLLLLLGVVREMEARNVTPLRPQGW